jgi:hypothetical protein
VCTDCIPGRYSKVSGGSEDGCLACAEGKWADSFGQNADCISCAPGRFSNITGANSVTKCIECPGGRTSSYGATSCSVCPAGTFSLPGSIAGCQDCNLRQFASLPGQAECAPFKNCAKGYGRDPTRVRSTTEDTTCIRCVGENSVNESVDDSVCGAPAVCAAGTGFLHGGSVKTCAPCATGFYNPVSKAASCIDARSNSQDWCVDPNSMSGVTMQESTASCRCKAGYQGKPTWDTQKGVWSANNCQLCPAGRSWRLRVGRDSADCPGNVECQFVE